MRRPIMVSLISIAVVVMLLAVWVFVYVPAEARCMMAHTVNGYPPGYVPPSYDPAAECRFPVGYVFPLLFRSSR